MNRVLLQAQNISKVYGEASKTIAVNNINLQIREGEIVSIVGKSGSGKSTLLYMLSGVETPTTGTIKLFDKDIAKLREKEKSILRLSKIGFVFQFFNLIPNYSAYDNAILPAMLAKNRISQDRVNELFSIVGLGDKKASLPSQLSGGEQQRVAIIRALINNPRIIFADEPTGNLDSSSGKRIIDLLFDLTRKENKTLVYVTHDIAIAQKANRIVELSDGEIINETTNICKEYKV